jgi:hypothetical protein
MEVDEEARLQRAEDLVITLARRLDGPQVRVQRGFPNEAGQSIARALLTFNGNQARARRDRAIQLLWEGTPAIEVEPLGDNALYVNPITIDEIEEPSVIERVCEVVAAVTT